MENTRRVTNSTGTGAGQQQAQKTMNLILHSWMAEWRGLLDLPPISSRLLDHVYRRDPEQEEFFWDQSKNIKPTLAGCQYMGEAYLRVRRLQLEEDYGCGHDRLH